MVYKNNSLNNTANEDFLVTTATAGADRKLSVTNTDNSAAASAAHVQVTVGGTTSTGDPYTNYLVTGGGTFSIGIDNSDSDKLKITTGASPSAGSTAIELLSAGTVNVLLGDLVTSRSQVGALVQLSVENTDTGNTSSAARLNIGNGGAGGGDAYILFDVNGSAPQSWEMGDDATDGSFNLNFNITPGTANLTGTNALKVTAAGEITYPLQPAFLAYQASAAVNVSGTGGLYTLGTTVDLTEIFDQNSDFDPATGIFTAPITGRYKLGVNVYWNGLTITSVFINNIVTSNRTYNNYLSRSVSNFDGTNILETLADMDAGDTCTFGVATFGEAGVTADCYGAAGMYTWCYANLEC